MAQSEAGVANRAVVLLGEGSGSIATLSSDTTKAGMVFNQILETCRQSLLRAHPWNFAIFETTLTLPQITGAADNGSGLIRLTTGSAHGLTTGATATVMNVLGTTEANGEWEVTVINSTTVDLVDSEFVSAYVSGGVIGLATQDYAFTYSLPTGFLRLLRIGDPDTDGPSYEIQGSKLLADETELDIRYVKDVTDYTAMDPLFYECLALRLAHDGCYAITQSGTLMRELGERLTYCIGKARFVDSTENPRKELTSNQWVNSRTARSARFPRDPMT